MGFLLLLVVLFFSFSGITSSYAAVTSNSSHDSTYSGIWAGELMQKPGSYLKSYPFFLNITVQKSNIFGYSQIEANGPYAIMEISGTINPHNLSISEDHFIERQDPGGTYWLLKNITLQMDAKNTSRMNGSWVDQKLEPLGLGSISLEKCADCKIDKSGHKILRTSGNTTQILDNGENITHLVFYSRNNCKNCDVIRKLLIKYEIGFEEINPDKLKASDPANADFRINNPKLTVPVVVYKGTRFVGINITDILSLQKSGLIPNITDLSKNMNTKP